jgi:hypothetical protein
MILKLKRLACALDIDIFVGIAVYKSEKKGLELYYER